MSETAESPPAEIEPPKKKQPSSWPKPGMKRKIGHRQKCALLEIIHRKKLNWNVDYRGVATRYGIAMETLKQAYTLWKRGLIDMGEVDSPQQAQLDARTQYQEQMTLMIEVKQLALNCLRAVVLLSREDAAKGDPMAPIKRGLPQTLGMLDKIHAMMAKTEEGYNAVLEDARLARAGFEKPVNGSVVPPDVKAGMVSASDEQRAIAALKAPDDTPGE